MQGSRFTTLLLVVTSIFLGSDVYGLSNHENGAEPRVLIEVGPDATATVGAKDNPSSQPVDEQYPSVLDPVWSLWFFISQVYHAQVNDTFPTVSGWPLRITPVSDGFYRLHPCKRTDLAKCMYHGNSSPFLAD